MTDKPLTALQENAARLFVEGNTQADERCECQALEPGTFIKVYNRRAGFLGRRMQWVCAECDGEIKMYGGSFARSNT